MPTITGLVTVNGTQVVSHNVPIETRSRALNEYNVEVQISSANATSDPIKNGLSHFLSAQLSVNANGLVSLAGGVGPAVQRINRQVFTANGTYTPTTNMVYCDVEVMGGGGGGGGVNASVIGAASSGGAGGYAKGLFIAATIGASKVVTIGAGAAGGTNVGGAGADGGTTSLGALISATGGEGGFGSNGDVSPGRNGGLGIGGDFQTRGSSGSFGYENPSGLILSGPGGSTFFGGGAPSASCGFGASVPGNGGQSYGGGGSGAANSNSALGNTGGTGFAGVIIITEYIA